MSNQYDHDDFNEGAPPPWGMGRIELPANTFQHPPANEVTKEQIDQIFYLTPPPTEWATVTDKSGSHAPMTYRQFDDLMRLETVDALRQMHNSPADIAKREKEDQANRERLAQLETVGRRRPVFEFDEKEHFVAPMSLEEAKREITEILKKFEKDNGLTVTGLELTGTASAGAKGPVVRTRRVNIIYQEVDEYRWGEV